MKRFLLLTLVSMSLLTACNSENNTNANDNNDINTNIDDNDNDNKPQNIKTIDYKNVKAIDLHPAVDQGYVEVPYVTIGGLTYETLEEEKTYLYKLSCKTKTDSFQNHLFECAEDGCFYVELSESQHAYVSEGFDILWNSNKSGSAVEVTIDEVFKCYSYREIFYSESENMVKVVYYDHVIPGLEETKVSLLMNVPVEKRPYVDETKVRTSSDGNFPFTTEIEIDYIDLADKTFVIGK